MTKAYQVWEIAGDCCENYEILCITCFDKKVARKYKKRIEKSYTKEELEETYFVIREIKIY